MPIPELSATFDGATNNYQYNNKELNEDFGLHWMDYGARWYNPQINLWGQVDPLAEKYAAWGGYNYVLGNPVRLIDYNGMDTTVYVKFDPNSKLFSGGNKMAKANAIELKAMETSADFDDMVTQMEPSDQYVFFCNGGAGCPNFEPNEAGLTSAQAYQFSRVNLGYKDFYAEGVPHNPRDDTPLFEINFRAFGT